MKTSEDSALVVNRLLHCLHRGLAPALPRVKSSEASGSPGSPMPVQASNFKCKATESASNFMTPDLKDLKLKSFTKEVSPGVFYGSPAGKCSKRPPQVLRLLHEIRRDLASEGYSASRNVIWATFGKQEQAMQYVQSDKSRELALFVYQDHVTGQRRFLATTYKEFWCRYETMPPDHRHHYEIITEGSPCHLYFDLEFDRKANIGLDGNALVDSLLLQVADALYDVYSLKYEPSWTVELDSTTEGKFSRHIVIRVPNVAFKDNSHVGAFVAELCSRLDQRRHDDASINDLYVLKGQSQIDCCSQLFVDQAVYSRNRSFRLPFSSKAGKTSRLIPSRRLCCKDKSEHEVFEDSLICRVGTECKRFLTFSSEITGHGGSFVAGCASDIHASCRMSKAAEFCAFGRSPFKEIDIFIESIACIGGIPGRIRNWYWFSEYGVLVYNIEGNRYCENIGRQHKSNKVMYIVDFRTLGYYQKCHDPDCRGYRSPLRPIPRQMIPASVPSSMSFESCYVNTEMEVTHFAHGECSAGILSRLSITKDSQNVKHGICENNLALRESDEMGEDENEWWKEVLSSMENSEQNQNTNINKQSDSLKVFPMDDDEWWELESVQQELEAHVLQQYSKQF